MSANPIPTIAGECPKCRENSIVAVDKCLVRCLYCSYSAPAGEYAKEVDREHGMAGADR